jgi:hypothetical protein
MMSLANARSTPANKNYTKEDDQYIVENYHWVTSQEIADHLGRSRSSVQGRAHRLGLSNPQGPNG